MELADRRARLRIQVDGPRQLSAFFVFHWVEIFRRFRRASARPATREGPLRGRSPLAQMTSGALRLAAPENSITLLLALGLQLPGVQLQLGGGPSFGLEPELSLTWSDLARSGAARLGSARRGPVARRWARASCALVWPLTTRPRGQVPASERASGRRAPWARGGEANDTGQGSGRTSFVRARCRVTRAHSATGACARAPPRHCRATSASPIGATQFCLHQLASATARPAPLGRGRGRR